MQKVIIIDLGKEQIESVKALVSKKYADKQIEVRQANALNLSFIPNKSVDWIETDGFLGFFDRETLPILLKEWKRVLKDEGFITFRDFAHHAFIEIIVDRARILIAKYTVQAKLTERTKSEMNSAFTQAGYKFNSDKTLIPGFYRYCLVKKV